MFENINWLAVVAATLSTFVIGAVWYSPLLFVNTWMEAAGIDKENTDKGNMGKIFGLAFVFELIMAFNLAMFFYGSPESTAMMDAGTGAVYGFLTGFGWVFFAMAVNSLFEQRSWKYMLINGGYWTVSFTIVGLILGAWK